MLPFKTTCCEPTHGSHGLGTPGWQARAERQKLGGREKNGAKSRFLIKAQIFNGKCAYKVGEAFLPIRPWSLEPEQDRV